MAKSVSVLLVVLAVTVSLHAARRVSAAGAHLEGYLSRFDSWFEHNEKWLEVKEKPDGLKDGVEAAIKTFGDKDSTRTLPHWRVTDIKVGGKKLPIGEGSVILLISTTPLPFLNKEALGLLKHELPGSELNGNANFHQLCYAGGMTPTPVTLVYTDKGTDKELERTWHKQSDGSMCLGILPSPWA